jgi:tetratricopeptide (TPR) repeat protein
LLDLLRRSAFDVGASRRSDGPPPPDDSHIDDRVKSVLAKLWWRRPEATKTFLYTELIDIQREFIALDAGTPVYNVSTLNRLVLQHDSRERVDEFFNDQIGIERSALDVEAQRREVASWAKLTGDGFSALRLNTSIARLTDDSDLELRLLEEAIEIPDLSGLAWLRRVDFATRREGPEAVRRCLIRADDALPDDYQWMLLLGDVSFNFEEYELAIDHFARALQLRPDLPTSHELVILGWLANASEQSGDALRGASFRAQRDELELGRFREYTRHYYQQVVDSVRLRGIPVIAMQYPLLSVESLRKLLDYREDVHYVENRTNFEAALIDAGYRNLFSDSFAGSFGHLTDRGNMLVAENAANALTAMMSDLEQRAENPAHPAAGSP